ncbi:hypothetical protein BC831DRAFT_488476 [Entophlyctis helioformis]|nr:hypothetical protein BC831DRAFT_488476 [Entophlyctis helioformis]
MCYCRYRQKKTEYRGRISTRVAPADTFAVIHDEATNLLNDLNGLKNRRISKGNSITLVNQRQTAIALLQKVIEQAAVLCACTVLARLLIILLHRLVLLHRCPSHLTTIALNKHTARNFSLVYLMTLIRRRHSNSLRRQRLHMQRRMPSELRRLRREYHQEKQEEVRATPPEGPISNNDKHVNTNIMIDGRHIWMLRAIAA